MKNRFFKWIAAPVVATVVGLAAMSIPVAPTAQAQSAAQPQAEQVVFGQSQEELVWNSLPNNGEVVAADTAPAPQWSGSAEWNRKTSVVKFLVHTKNFPADGVAAIVRGYINGQQVLTDNIMLSGDTPLGVEVYRKVHPEVTFPSELKLEIDVFGQTSYHVYKTPEQAPTFGWMWFDPGVCGQQAATIQGQGQLDPHNEVFVGPSVNGPWTFIQSFELPTDAWETGIMPVTEQFPAQFWIKQEFYGGASQDNPRGTKTDGPFNRPNCSQTATPTPTPVITETPTATPTETPTPVWTITPTVTPPGNPAAYAEATCSAWSGWVSIDANHTALIEFTVTVNGNHQFTALGKLAKGEKQKFGAPSNLNLLSDGNVVVISYKVTSDDGVVVQDSKSFNLDCGTPPPPVPGSVFIPALCRECKPPVVVVPEKRVVIVDGDPVGVCVSVPADWTPVSLVNKTTQKTHWPVYDPNPTRVLEQNGLTIDYLLKYVSFDSDKPTEQRVNYVAGVSVRLNGVELQPKLEDGWMVVHAEGIDVRWKGRRFTTHGETYQDALRVQVQFTDVGVGHLADFWNSCTSKVQPEVEGVSATSIEEYVYDE